MATYLNWCSDPSSLFSTAADAVPYLTLDLGSDNTRITAVQLWTGASYKNWLQPVAVYVSNGSTATAAGGPPPGATPCWANTADAHMETSLSGHCNATGRYMTLALLGPNPAGAWVLRLCALCVFGTTQPLSPPPPVPLPPAPIVDPAAVNNALSDNNLLAIGLSLGGAVLLASAVAAGMALRRRAAARAAGGKTTREMEIAAASARATRLQALLSVADEAHTGAAQQAAVQPLNDKWWRV